jgi:hypothetical protein
MKNLTTHPFVTNEKLRKGILNNWFQPTDYDEIRDFSETFIFKNEPIFDLDNRSKEFLKESINTSMYNFYNHKWFKNLTMEEFSYIKSSEDKMPSYVKKCFEGFKNKKLKGLLINQEIDPSFFSFNDKESGMFVSTRKRLLREELKNIVFNYETATNTMLIKESGNLFPKLGSMGYRNLSDYPQMKRWLHEKINEKLLSNSKVTILDIGGGTGEVLFDLKKIYGNKIHTINQTITIEPFAYQGDELLVSPVEYMPENFKERIDIAISNFSFIYTTFPWVGIEAVLASLKINGYAWLEIGTIDCKSPQSVCHSEMRKTWDRFSKIQRQGLIYMKFKRIDQNNIHGKFEGLKNNFFPYGRLILKKYQ